MKRPKIAVAGVYHETNSFAPGITDLTSFEWEWVEGMSAFSERYAGTRTSMGGVLDAAQELDVELFPGLYTETMPSGLVTKDACETIMKNIVASLHKESEGLVLILHGAMVADGYPDVEGELLRLIRDRMGPDFPIAVTLDLHANISEAMAELSDFIVGYDTYPHTDMYERAVEATSLLVRRLQRNTRPKTVLKRPGMLVAPQTMLTTEPGPMQELLERAFEIEKDPRVFNVTVAGGFPYSDVPSAGMAFLVTTDGDETLAEQYAEMLCEYAWAERGRFQFPAVTAEEAIREAGEQKDGPVILVEGSDNVGGGSPADATHILRHLVRSPYKSLVVLRDAEAVNLAHERGVGETLETRVGGKSDRQHGEPVPISGKVRLLFDGVHRYVGPYMTGKLVNMGRTAVVETDHVTLVLTEKRTPPFDIGHIRSVGLDPTQFHIVVVKAAVAWRTAFGDIAKHVIHVDTPGCTSANLAHFQYRHLNRPVFPLDN